MLSSSSQLSIALAKDRLVTICCLLALPSTVMQDTPLSSRIVLSITTPQRLRAVPGSNLARSRALITPPCSRSSAYLRPTPQTSLTGVAAKQSCSNDGEHEPRSQIWASSTG